MKNRHKILMSLVLAFVIMLSYFNVNNSVLAEVEVVDYTVYYVPNGTVYHAYTECPSLSRSRDIREMKISSAINRGLPPCSRCRAASLERDYLENLEKSLLPPIEITKTKKVKIGYTTKIYLKNATSSVRWSKSNSRVDIKEATSEYVVIKGVKRGKVTIIANTGGEEYKCHVKVKPDGIVTNPKKASVFIGDKLSVKLLKNKKNHKVTWSVSNDCISLLSFSKKKAVIQALKPGKVKLIARIHGKNRKCVIIVKDDGIVTDPTEKSLYMGESSTVKILNNTKKYKVKWSIDNDNVKILSSSKKKIELQPLKVGTTTLTARVHGIDRICKVSVKEVASIKNLKYLTRSVSFTVTNNTEDDIKINPSCFVADRNKTGKATLVYSSTTSRVISSGSSRTYTYNMSSDYDPNSMGIMAVFETVDENLKYDKYAYINNPVTKVNGLKPFTDDSDYYLK